MTKTRLGLFALLAVALILPLSAKAMMVKAEDSVYVPKDQVVASSLYAAGSSITIDGKIQGDLVCAGQSITVNGTVDGDVLCVGQSIIINGNVGGSVRGAGNSITIAGKVARNVTVAGANVTVNPDATIGWDLSFASAFADLRGKIGRDVDGAGAAATIAGTIGRNVYLLLDDNRSKENNPRPSLTVSSTAKLNGNLTYRAKSDAAIEEGSAIKGEVKKEDYKAFNKNERRDSKNGWAWGMLFGIFSSLIIGLVFVGWLKRPAREITDIMHAKPWPSIGWGLIVSIVAPIAAFIVCITIIGLPLGIIMFAAWLLSLCIGSIVFGVMFGRWLMKKFDKAPEQPSLMWPMVIGIVVSSIIFTIPVLGWLLCMIATLWGIGGIWQYARAKS